MSENANRQPELLDMFVAGLPLRDALAFIDRIEYEPRVEAAVWWAELSRLAAAPSIQ